MTALATKTVVFVTHQVEFLPAADLILVFPDTCIFIAKKLKYNKKHIFIANDITNCSGSRLEQLRY